MPTISAASLTMDEKVQKGSRMFNFNADDTTDTTISASAKVGRDKYGLLQSRRVRPKKMFSLVVDKN